MWKNLKNAQYCCTWKILLLSINFVFKYFEALMSFEEFESLATEDKPAGIPLCDCVTPRYLQTRPEIIKPCMQGIYLTEQIGAAMV
jgi:hypothetical protein